MENGLEESPLFDPQLLKEIDWDTTKASFRDGISCQNPGENLVLRPLHTGDYDKGFISVLSQLTNIGEVSQASFLERFECMKACTNSYYITVIEDVTKSTVIACATLAMEQKFIHSAGTRGRIEDVIVSSEYRGKQLGKLLVETLTLLGRQHGCYKISLECTEENAKFYEPHGFNRDGQVFLVQRYKD